MRPSGRGTGLVGLDDYPVIADDSPLLPDLRGERVASERTLPCQKIGELKSIVRRNARPFSESEGDCCWHQGLTLFEAKCRPSGWPS
jgi:hypothetical protein